VIRTCPLEALGVNVTLQDPEARVQVVLLKLPVLLLVNETVPVGVIPPAPDASETVAVQVVGVPVVTVAGEQETPVLDALKVEARVNVPLLPVCTLSPP